MKYLFLTLIILSGCDADTDGSCDVETQEKRQDFVSGCINFHAVSDIDELQEVIERCELESYKAYCAN